MTLRLALVTGHSEHDALPQGVVRLAAVGAATLVGDADVPVVAMGDAILIGWAFRKGRDQPCDRLAPQEAVAIIESAGRWAIDRLWGNYIVMWKAEDGAPHILRSPITGPAVYHVVGAEGPQGPDSRSRIAFTDLALARSLGFALDRPDAQAIDAELRIPLLRSPTTGLKDVREILPGEIVRLGAPTALPQSWRPWDYVDASRRADPDALRSQVMRVVSAWSGRFGRIQLELSGGLDSSIVAACLAGRRSPWRAITMATPDPDGDERVYARAAADRARAPLFELLLAGEAADPVAPLRHLRPRPGGFGLLAPVDGALFSAAKDYGAEAIFTGAGGDNVFGYLTSAAPIVDALRFAGPAAAWRAAGDLARVMNDNIWKALRLAARKLVVPGAFWPTDATLLSSRFAANPPQHPWFDGASTAWPGQRTYALKLLPIQPFLDGYDRALALPMIAPLLSQPLVEYGLGVPSWQWFEGGRDRALARDTFRSDLPDIILARRIKGRIESLFYPSFDLNRTALRHFLLDGWLASESLIDCDAVAALIDGKVRADGVAVIRLLHLADIERWVRSIIGRP
ncbi:asparagine synthase-related protein [Sphingopyxis sp.]|uniref:asparagine synthase-related protein n=1 Tax=Sphingopyxis sp. TaxID=1908224 RepID=UPI002FC76C61